MKNCLFVITARGGSKGIPGKNLKALGQKPLICFSIDYARLFTGDENICLSTDDEKITRVAENYGLKIPFKRPGNLASDQAGSYEVLVHALNFYETQGKNYGAVALLQPTSPFRLKSHLQEAFKLFSNEIDMVMSVSLTRANPYNLLYEEDSSGFLHAFVKSDVTRRQDAPPVYETNGSIYIINSISLKKHASFNEFSFVKKYLMPGEYSLDLDTPLDWSFAEFILKNNLVEI